MTSEAQSSGNHHVDPCSAGQCPPPPSFPEGLPMIPKFPFEAVSLRRGCAPAVLHEDSSSGYARDMHLRTRPIYPRNHIPWLTNCDSLRLSVSSLFRTSRKVRSAFSQCIPPASSSLSPAASLLWLHHAKHLVLWQMSPPSPTKARRSAMRKYMVAVCHPPGPP